MMFRWISEVPPPMGPLIDSRYEVNTRPYSSAHGDPG
jgi:hypothetical protein